MDKEEKKNMKKETLVIIIRILDIIQPITIKACLSETTLIIPTFTLFLLFELLEKFIKFQADSSSRSIDRSTFRIADKSVGVSPRSSRLNRSYV